MSGRLGLLFVSLSVICALLGGGYAHAVIPHDEGDHHSQKEIVWSSLHAALGHEQKQFALAAIPVLTTFGLAALILVPVRRFAFVIAAAPKRHRLLCKGALSYRRFG